MGRTIWTIYGPKDENAVFSVINVLAHKTSVNDSGIRPPNWQPKEVYTRRCLGILGINLSTQGTNKVEAMTKTINMNIMMI